MGSLSLFRHSSLISLDIMTVNYEAQLETAWVAAQLRDSGINLPVR